jgi:hypothetical protein
MRAVFPDELHEDAPVTLAAMREMRAAADPQGRHVVVDGTGHNIPRDRPDVVAGTILAVAAQARASGGVSGQSESRDPPRHRVTRERHPGE